MARLDVRCKVDLPVSVMFDCDKKSGITETKFTSLSLGGGFIEVDTPCVENKIIGLKYDLPKYGEFEVMGEIMRSDENGIATQFHNLNRDAKLKLWDYIRENI